MEQSKVVHEAHAQREKKFMVENADELAAKYNREKLKQRRAEYEAKKKKEEAAAKRDEESSSRDTQQHQQRDGSNRRGQTEESYDDEHDEEEDRNYPPPAPFGQWQTVESKPEAPYVDLQLPEQSRYQYTPVITAEEPKPVKVFKEKVVGTLDKETTSSESGVFKKRKINITLKKNSRQRTEEY